MDKKIDLIFSSNTLEHIDLNSVNLVLEQCAKILKKGGKLVLVGPNFKYSYKNYYDDPTHLTPLSHTTLILICEKFGLKPFTIYPKFLPYTMQSSMGGPQFLERVPKLAKLLLRFYIMMPIKPFAGQFLLVFEK